MSSRRHWATRGLLGALVLVAGTASFAPAASAHPLGNLSVNHFHGLVVRADRVVDDAVVDTAEIPAAQAQGVVDVDGDGTASPTELAAYAQAQCALLAAAVTLTVDGQPHALSVTSTSFVYRPGQAGLATSRLECRLEAAIDVGSAETIVLADSFLADRVGWHEMTAVGDGVTLVDPPVPTESITGRLDHYPLDLLSSPLAARRVTLQVVPGVAAAPVVAPPPTARRTGTVSIEALGPFAGVVERINRSFNDLVGRRQLTVGVGSLAIALALLLGASHAVLPGHGKTVMAAYIAGRQGSVRDAVLVGATVTATHTGGVLLLGLALTASTALAGEVVLGWLGIASGVIIATLGISLLLAARRRKELSWGGHRHGPGGHTHTLARHDHHGHGADHDHEHHDHEHHDHDHEHHDHDHDHHEHGVLPAVTSATSVDTMTRPTDAAVFVRAPRGTTVSRRGLVGMGVAGGLVPSPSALVVLLSAIALGRTSFGVLLVVAYGVGMASTLTLAGILLVRVRDRYQRRARSQPGRSGRVAAGWTRLAPFVTAALVVIVGVGLAVRSIALV